MTKTHDIKSYFGELSRTIGNLPFLALDEIAETILNAYYQGRMIFLLGNGGSAALASHLACDLGKGTINGHSRRFRVIALTDNVPLMTAWANDSSYEDVFSQQLSNLVSRDDIVFAISGSGNSPNVLSALRVARSAGAVTIGLSGFEGGKMKELCDLCMIVPCDNMQIIEDLHLCTAHALFTAVRHRLYCQTEAVAAASD